jgi:uncharacterized glyoxalase superfamily metalloenzyme YdcJ
MKKKEEENKVNNQDRKTVEPAELTTFVPTSTAVIFQCEFVQTNSQRTNANNHSPYYISYESGHPRETSIRGAQQIAKATTRTNNPPQNCKCKQLMPSIWWHSAFLQIQD